MHAVLSDVRCGCHWPLSSSVWLFPGLLRLSGVLAPRATVCSRNASPSIRGAFYAKNKFTCKTLNADKCRWSYCALLYFLTHIMYCVMMEKVSDNEVSICGIPVSEKLKALHQMLVSRQFFYSWSFIMWMTVDILTTIISGTKPQPPVYSGQPIIFWTMIHAKLV